MGDCYGSGEYSIYHSAGRAEAGLGYRKTPCAKTQVENKTNVHKALDHRNVEMLKFSIRLWFSKPSLFFSTSCYVYLGVGSHQPISTFCRCNKIRSSSKGLNRHRLRSSSHNEPRRSCTFADGSPIHQRRKNENQIPHKESGGQSRLLEECEDDTKQKKSFVNK